MFADDLFKKLKPILGEEMYPLQAVYMAGDDESKRNVERVLRVAYSNVVNGIYPPAINISSGKYPLGTVISGDKAMYPFSLRDEDFFHVGIFGQTGRGKTNAMLHLLNELRKQNIPWLVFDWKRAGYRDLTSKYDDVIVFTVGRDISPFHLNPLIPPPGVDNITWYKQFIQCISHAYFLGHGCEVILQDVIGNDTHTLIDIIEKLNSYPAKWRKLQWLQSTERAVKALCYGGISKVLNTNSPPITEWLDKNVIFELDALTDSEAKFLVNIVMSQIYLYRKENQHRGLKHVSVIEEAHNVLKKEPESIEAKSVMDKIFREIREYGESIVIIDQMPSTILNSAIANTATQITFSLKHSEDVKAAGKAMLLDHHDSQFLGKLPVGTAIVKLQNRWHAPFMIRFPYFPIKAGKVSDDHIKFQRQLEPIEVQNAPDKNSKPDSASCSAQNKSEQPSVGNSKDIPTVLNTDKIGRTGQNILLADIMQNPVSSIRERYKRLKFSAYLGDKYQKALISEDLIRSISIANGKGMIKLVEVTENGKAKLRKLGYSISCSWRHGGVDHQYWVAQVKKKLIDAGYHPKEEYPIGNGKTVDLAIIGKNKKIAIEIETGKSDAIKNIRKCLDAGFEVVSIPSNPHTLKKTKSSLKHFSDQELKKIRIRST